MNDEEEAPLKQIRKIDTAQRCAPCSAGRACSFLMVPFVLGIVSVTYIPYVKRFNDGSLVSGICLLIFHFLLFMMIASYFQVIVS